MRKVTETPVHRCLLGSAAFPEILPETKAALDAMCRMQRYRAGQTVIQEGETTDLIGCVLTGILRMQKTLADGRQHIVGLLVERDMFGRVFGGSNEFAIEAASDVEFCAYPRGAFEDLLMRSPDLDRAVLLNILNELDRARDWLIILSNQKIVARVAGFLTLMCSRFAYVDHLLQARDEGLEVKIPIGREDLAHLLGTRPESISRAIHWLEDEGDIRILEPNRILIRDLQSLARRAGEDEIESIPSLKDLLAANRPSR